jgi:X-Pro dipeptidyl-peptidase
MNTRMSERESPAGEQSDDEEILREDYWVAVAGQDSDGTGEADRVHVEIARPASTEEPDVTLPVVVQPSPYYGEGNPQPLYEMAVELWYPGKTDDETTGATGELTGETLTQEDLLEFTGTEGVSIGPSFYEEEFIQQGYVWAYAASVGTEESTGCLDTGGEFECAGLEAVVDWFNGRATAYDTKQGGSPVEADWTDGTTGMIGRSYNGTLPNAAASRGIEGLATIVPIAAISSWYSYYRMNGHVVSPGSLEFQSVGVDTDTLQQANLEEPDSCTQVTELLAENQDRQTGNYSEFWAQRDYRADASNVEASVLAVHGLSDYNVRPRNVAEWVGALADHDVPYKLWFHQGGHSPNPRDFHPDQWLGLLEEWLAYWLRGVDNGVMDGPTAWIQRGDTDGPLETYDDWPDPTSEAATVRFAPGGDGIGGLELYSDATSVESLVDNSTAFASVTNLVSAAESDHRLLYRTAPLEESVRLGGTPTADLRLSFDEPAAIVSVALVDYDQSGDASIVTLGWMNPHNRESLDEALPVEPGESYRLQFPMQPVDHVFQSGHRIGVAVYSSDYHFTKRPPTDPELSLSLAESGVEFPVVGGKQALAEALGATDELVAVEAAGETVGTGGEATVQLDVTNATTVTVDGLWTGWAVGASDVGSGEFERNGRTAVLSYDGPTSADPSITVQPSAQYVSGTYLLHVAATDGEVDATDTATINIE